VPTSRQVRLFPKYFEKTNEAKVPANALLLTNIIVQVFLIVTMFTTYAFQLALELTSALTLIPYLLVAAYALKLAYTGETYEKDASERNKELAIAGIATVYSILMIYSAPQVHPALALIYLPATLLFWRAARMPARRFRQERDVAVRVDRRRCSDRSLVARHRRITV